MPRIPWMREETIRVEAFSDGVFAIAITLLILDIRVPHELPAGALKGALVRLLPSFIAFVVSFLTIGVMWMNHHRLFTVIGKTDERLQVTNLLLLFGICFVPFPTALLAEYMSRPDGWIAAIFYNSSLLYLAFTFNLLWLDASKGRRLIVDDAEEESIEAITKQYRWGPILYTGFLVFASFHPLATMTAHLAAAVYFGIPPGWLHRRNHEHHHHHG